MEFDQNVAQKLSGPHKASPFKGVKLTGNNNFDIFVYEREFKATEKIPYSRRNVYENFLVSFVQAALVGAALEKLSLKNLWEPGELFEIATSVQFFNDFRAYLSHASISSTLMNKAASLIKFVDQALEFYTLHPRYPEDQIVNSG